MNKLVFDYINKEVNNNKNIIKIIILNTIFWSIFAHGMAYFNLYAFFDNADLFNIGNTYRLGRWFLGVLSWLTMYVSGSLLYSTPLFNSVLTFIFIGITTYLIVDLLEIKKTLLIIILNAIMVVFPAVTSTLGYMFTAPYYFLGILIGVFGIYLYYKNKKWYSFLIAAILLACGIGTYQANIPVFVGLILLLTYKDATENNEDIKTFILTSLKNIGLCLSMLVCYLLANKFFLTIRHETMSEYKGTSSFENVSINTYLNRIVLAYKEFFNPTNNCSRNMYPFSLNQFYKILLILIFVLIVISLIKSFKQSKLIGIESIVLLLFIPLANNFSYLLCDVSYVYSIMMYGEVTLFIFVTYLLDRLDTKAILNDLIKTITCLLLVVFCFLYAKFDNNCYLKADVLQKQVNSYITTMVTQIKSLDGYRDDMKIVYINEANKKDLSVPSYEQFEAIYIHPYHLNTLLNDYNFRGIMEKQVGFFPEKIEQANFGHEEEISHMSCYPDSGSIKIINDTVVIKFSEK